MNNKGFTLVELLAVIVILSLIALLASTSVTKVLKESKDELSGIQLGEIKEAAETWSMDNLNKLPGNGECAYITVEDLKEYGVLDTNINNPKNNKQISNDLKIKITSNTGKDGNLITNYEVDSKDIDVCRYIYSVEPATKENKTLAGTIPKGNFEPGDEYIVNVDLIHKYHFYVLSIEEDKVKLIMSNNICSDGTLATATNRCKVEWASKIDYNEDTNYGENGNNNKGPITAMNYLYEVTKNWSNMPNIWMNYTDEGNRYGEIKTEENMTKITMKDGVEIKNYRDLKARLITKREIIEVGCGDDSGSCPAWMVNGLSSYTDKYPTGTKEDISFILGYWSLSSGGASYSQIVHNRGIIGGDYVSTPNDGIRPVIELPKSYFS